MFKEINGCMVDENNNKALIEYFGSKDKAIESLKTLVNCTNCMNCTNCTYCTDCTNCTNCRNCTNCTYCVNCRNCVNCMNCINCDFTNKHYFLPVSESRGFTWLAIFRDKEWRIKAGCRDFSIQEAKDHWLSDSYRGPIEVKETVKFALEWLEEKNAN